MATLTVGPGQQFTTIAAAVAASSDGDTVDVQAGTYTNDFFYIGHSLTLQAVGGMAQIIATVEPDNGKAIITEGVRGASVTINGFDISGAAVADENGAAIRYEGGNLSLSNDYFHDNQDGLLAASDPSGSISVDHSEFAFNGVGGDGHTHNLYVNNIASLSITNSYFHDANEGHEIKSRAANTTITGNRIFDNNSTASYSVDLPNGGNATIANNVIEQGPHSDNPYILAVGEEGVGYAGSNVSVSGNTIVNDLSGGRDVLNPNGVPVSYASNQAWGIAWPGGNTVFLADRPSLDTSSLSFIDPTGSSGGSDPSSGSTGGSDGTGAASPPPPPPSPSTLPLIDTATWQAEVLNDFVTYAMANPAAWSDANAIQALTTEFFDPLTGSQGIPAAAAWGPFPAGS